MKKAVVSVKFVPFTVKVVSVFNVAVDGVTELTVGAGKVMFTEKL